MEKLDFVTPRKSYKKERPVPMYNNRWEEVCPVCSTAENIYLDFDGCIGVITSIENKNITVHWLKVGENHHYLKASGWSTMELKVSEKFIDLF